MSEIPFSQWLKSHEERIVPLEKELTLASWNLATTGKKEFESAVARLRATYLKIYANAQDFDYLSQLKSKSNDLTEIQSRQLSLLWETYAQYQFDPKLIEQITQIEAELEGIYSNFRGKVDDKEVDNNYIRKTLRQDSHSAKRQAAWEASKQIGPKVAGKVLELVKLRNQGARQCGFENYYQMSLSLSELSPKKLFNLFDDLAQKTQESFQAAKTELDQAQAKRFGIEVSDIKPWHYSDPFFQQAPEPEGLNLDGIFKDKDIIALTHRTFKGLGLEIDGIVEKSDLFPRPGKDQHAFCCRIGRDRDVRILCNIEPSEYWMSTMLHEFGHGVYDWYLDQDLPFFLRSPAHILSTEAIAMLMGRLTQNSLWLEKILGLTENQARDLAEKCQKHLRFSMLIFVRWVLVMCHFERDLYENPDQDLNAKWWQWVEKFQNISPIKGRHEPDWATKLHLALAPVYYQNYLLGELVASQLEHYLLDQFPQDSGLIDNQKAGQYLLNKYFKPAARMRWDHLLESATGETLKPDYFAKAFI